MAGSFKSSEDIVKYYSDALFKLIDSVSKIVYLVFFFILFCWIYIIEGLNIRYKTFYADHNKQIEKLTIQLKSQKKKLYTLNYISDPKTNNGQPKDTNTILNSSKRPQLDVTYAKSLIDNTRLPSISDSLIKKIDQLKFEISNSASILEQKDFNEVIKDIPFPFKTIFYFTNSLKNGPQSLIIIITLLLIYVYFCRIKVLQYSARIIRVIKSDESLQINPHRDINITNPFWSSPIPIQNIHITDDEYIEFTGNKGNKYTYIIFLYAIFTILIGIEIRMLWLQISYNIYSPLNGLFFGTFFLVIVSICFVIDWISKWKIPDNFNNEENKIDYNRRRFILAGGSMALIMGVYFFSNKISKFIKPSNFKKKTVKYKLTSKKFYNNYVHNTRTKNYHFFDEKGHNPTIEFKSARGWKNFEDKSKITTSDYVMQKIIKKTHISSWMLEHLTLSFINQNKYEDAFNLLSDKIVEHSQNIRLWDLLAKIYFVSLKADEKHSKIFNNLCKNSNYYNPVLAKRIEKFTTDRWKNKLLSNKNNTFNNQKL